MDRLEKEKLSKIEVEGLQEKKPPKLSVIPIDMEAVKKSEQPSPASPKLRRALTKPSSSSSASGRWNCLCSPTTHAGSFRCRFHRAPGMPRGGSVGSNLSELAAKSRPISDLA